MDARAAGAYGVRVDQGYRIVRHGSRHLALPRGRIDHHGLLLASRRIGHHGGLLLTARRRVDDYSGLLLTRGRIGYHSLLLTSRRGRGRGLRLAGRRIGRHAACC